MPSISRSNSIVALDRKLSSIVEGDDIITGSLGPFINQDTRRTQKQTLLMEKTESKEPKKDSEESNHDVQIVNKSRAHYSNIFSTDR